MAGTDSTRPAASGGGPLIILVDPQLGENIGTACRAMANGGLDRLRLVRPRDGWPNERALAASAGALPDRVGVEVFADVGAAVADCVWLLATTARSRDMVKPVLTPRRAIAELCQRLLAGQRCGVLFGPERTGLVNEDITRADALLTVPLNPAFMSLNLGQAVLLLAYEWYQASDSTPDWDLPVHKALPATQAQFDNLMDHLIEELDESRFFATEDLRQVMITNLRNAFRRMGPTDQEVRTLHGAIVALTGRVRRRRPT